MLKLLSVILSASSLFIISMIMGPEPSVYVTAEVPEQIQPGSSCIIRMTVHKGNTLGFARIQQFLPEGFKAEALDSKNAQFIEDGQSIKFIWTQMPAEESFEITYKLIASSGISGLQVINGVLIYIEDEKTEQYALPPIEIHVSGIDSRTAQSDIPHVDRKLTATVPELNEYRVELTIQPNNEEKAARFIDQIPEGYEAFTESSHGAHFLFADGIVSFSWAKLPSDSIFTISYLVRSAQRRTPPSINGMLVYGNSAMDMELDSLDQKDELYEQALKSTEDPSEPADQIINELLSNENAKGQEENSSAELGTNSIFLPTSRSGIYYRVQISATMKSPARDNAWFQKYYKVTEDVNLSYEEGWKKYLIGNFDDFKSANLHKRKTREKVKDAFVVAYQDGQRIGLKEAMAARNSNQ